MHPICCIHVISIPHPIFLSDYLQSMRPSISWISKSQWPIVVSNILPSYCLLGDNENFLHAINDFTLGNCNILIATALISYYRIRNKFFINTNLHVLEEKRKTKSVHRLNTRIETRKLSIFYQYYEKANSFIIDWTRPMQLSVSPKVKNYSVSKISLNTRPYTL